VKIEGKNVQLLSDPMLNNCGPSGNPPNSATLLGVIQMGGLVVAVQEQPCPICWKTHGQLAETDESKASAKALSDAYHNWSAKGARPGGKPTMLGVVLCEDNENYADMSGTTSSRFAGGARAASMTAWPTPGSAQTEETMIEALRKVHGPDWNPTNFSNICREAKFRARASREEGFPAAYEPGNCAAQGAMLLLMDDGALAVAMTEQFYGGKDGTAKTGKEIHFLDNRDRENPMKPDHRKFGHGETTPPCKSCELILPFLLCTGKKPKCVHQGNVGERS